MPWILNTEMISELISSINDVDLSTEENMKAFIKKLMNSSDDATIKTVSEDNLSLIVSFLSKKCASFTDFDTTASPLKRITQHKDRFELLKRSISQELKDNQESPIERITSVLSFFEEKRYQDYSLLFVVDELDFLNSLITTLRRITNATEEADMEEKIRLLSRCLADLYTSISKIENDSECFADDVYRYAYAVYEELKRYIDTLYINSAPALQVEFYCYPTKNSVVLSITNQEQRLPATNIKINPLTGQQGADSNSENMLYSIGQTVRGGKTGEITVPFFQKGSNAKELSVELSYEYPSGFDCKTEHEELATVSRKMNIVIPPFNVDDSFYLTENKYKFHASGDPIKVENKDMFFGRAEDISEIMSFLRDESGNLCRSKIAAIYGQKRCGKSSVMNFLEGEIKNTYSKAITLCVNIQGFGFSLTNQDEFVKNLLYAIGNAFMDALFFGDYDDDVMEFSEIPNIFAESGGIEMFKRHFVKFGRKFPEMRVVLLLDEFTQIYNLLLNGAIPETFLNFWRAFIQETGFINIIVGQDFMPKLWTDSRITKLNAGGSVNGLGTVHARRLSYLKPKEARKLIEQPILLPNGKSRFVGNLGNEIISKIISLTGGSAFYLMKFCNALVDYMMKNSLIYVSIATVDYVAKEYIFNMESCPVTKIDFDPLYNEYSFSSNNQSEDLNEAAHQEKEINYKMLALIALSANERGVCHIRNIPWENEGEKMKILKSLITRGILVDERGKDLTDTQEISNKKVKIKVELFHIFLKRNERKLYD